MHRSISPVLFVTLLFFFNVYADTLKNTVDLQLSGLMVSHTVVSNAVNTMLYVTNQGDVGVICDARMKTDKKETKDSVEKRVEAGETAVFSLAHRKTVKSVQLFLKCVPFPKGEDKGKPKNTAVPLSGMPVEAKPLAVPTEDLGAFSR